MKTAKDIRKLLKSCISDVDSIKSMFCNSPEKNFTRNRKLKFKTLIRLILSMTCYSIPIELEKFFHCDVKMPTKSAFIQQRQKIKSEAFRELFDKFTAKADVQETFRGYRLLACDGSSVNLPRNPADSATSVHAKPTAESYNTLHINALYDLINHIYVDYTLDYGMNKAESAALCEMAGKLSERKNTILVADRGYGFLPNVYRLTQLNTHFVFRVKDITSNSFLTKMVPSVEEFDLDISKIMTRCHRKEFLNNPDYMVVNGRNSLDFSENKSYPVSFRACRFRLSSGGYECLITDLPRSEFSVSDLMLIYKMRWGIETSFRELKYLIGLMHFHSVKLNSVLQEVHAAMLMMNFCSLITYSVALCQKSTWKFRHKINFATAVGYCRSFLSSGKTDCLNLITRNQSLIRPHRQYDRYLHDTKPAKSLNYRVS